MCFTNIRPNQPFVKPPLYGEELLSVPDDSPGLQCASQGGGYDQPEIEALWRDLDPMIPRHDFRPHEAQTHSAEGDFPIQTTTESQKNPTMGGKVRPVCVYCNQDFGRVQELNRHVTDKHMPRRRCPFCGFMWSRPDKIKSHFLANHAERFTAEMLEGVKALCGQDIVKFVNGYDHGLDVEATSLYFNHEASQFNCKARGVPVAPATLDVNLNLYDRPCHETLSEAPS